MKEIIKIKAKVIKDEEGNFTIFDEISKGGAIVSNKDPLIAMENFKEATHLSLAVRTLLGFKINEGKNNKFYVAEFI